MKGKIIVITGATRGIGLELKNQLIKDNTVITMSRSEIENGKTSFKVDVSNRDEVKRAFDVIGATYKKIDILINNAGYGLSGATEDLPESEIRKITDVNFLGPIWCSQCALPYMERGSKIANISSASGISPMPYRALYNSTKAGLTSFSYSLNIETTHLGINVVAFILGPINTDFSNNRHLLTSTNPRYQDEVKAVDDFVAKQGTFGKMPVEKLAKFIIKHLDKKHVKFHYLVGTGFRAGYIFYKLFPITTMRLTAYFMKK